jgi:hypothetical protein
MAAALNQDFVTYSGDSITPVFTVLTAAGVAVDISTVTDITWTMRQEGSSTALITKTKSGAQITFVTSGTDGKFQVAILAADTMGLSGYYLHEASITDNTGKITTVSVGRMQIGVQPTWTYNPAQLTTNTTYQVRRLIGDVLYGDQQMQDDEIEWFTANYTNVWSAASAAAASLGAQFARLVDTVQGELRTLYGQRAKNYMLISGQLSNQSKGRGPAYAYAGGISAMDKEQQVENVDRVPPNFLIRMFDNVTVGQVGQQAIAAPLSEAFP